MRIIRFFDFLFSFFGILFLLPFFAVIYLLIVLESKGGGFYFQTRVGKDGVDFKLMKFRTMMTGSDNKGLITVGGRDARITRIGYYLRRLKIDELPQLFNVLFGQMSLVGPRPEVRLFVDLYNSEQKKILAVKPGITDYSSIEYSNENEILGAAADPHQKYIEEIMPRKIWLSMKYIQNPTVKEYFKIIFLTIKRIFN